MHKDDIYMQRCLELAQLGKGAAAPNPLVGSVIVHNDRIIGEGYHQRWGEAHAEVNAVNSVKQSELLPESTLYVNLEPCAHHGKTPPCSDLIIEKKIKRVVVGCVDSFSEVAGRGIERMKKAGVDVTVGVLEEESRELNRRFFTFHEKKRPYIILKWAETQDGFIDVIRSAEHPNAAWITNEISRSLVHKWRTEEMAFMVGTRTVELDNPKLNVRAWNGENPIRITIDRDLSLPNTLNLFDQSQPTIVFTELDVDSRPNLEYIKIAFSDNLLQQVLDELYRRNIQSLVIEGGEMLLTSSIESGLWDEALVFVGDRFFGHGIPAPKLKAKPSEHVFLQESQLYYYQNKR